MKINRKKFTDSQGIESEKIEFVFRNQKEFAIINRHLFDAVLDATMEPVTEEEIDTGTSFTDQTLAEYCYIHDQFEEGVRLSGKAYEPVVVTIDAELMEPLMSILITVCVKENIRKQRELLKETYESAKRLNETHFMEHTFPYDEEEEFFEDEMPVCNAIANFNIAERQFPFGLESDCCDEDFDFSLVEHEVPEDGEFPFSDFDFSMMCPVGNVPLHLEEELIPDDEDIDFEEDFYDEHEPE